MSVKVTDNTVNFENTVTQKASVFLRMFTDEVVKLAQPATPKDTTRLSQDILKQVLALKGKIVWNKKYASVQERGSRRDGSHKIKNYSTPGTGPHFAKNAVNSTMANVGTIMKKAGLT